MIGTVKLPNTGGAWDNYNTATAKLDQLVTGKLTICVVFKGSTTNGLLYVGNFDKMNFTRTA
ncbi:Carbohydrate binding module (family 6) [Paenibacillus sp. UNC496MF]|nr:Carbohydrate binding module (family 6) [Paenibacillus sp. UNC496MF]